MQTTYMARTAACAVLALSFGTSVHAGNVDRKGHFGWQVDARAEFGGDSLGTVSFEDNSTQSIKTGDGLSLNVGGHYRFANSPFDLSATIGFKYRGTKATNSDINVNRMVLEFLGTYFINDDWWLSAGPVLHQSIKYDRDQFGSTVNFDNASGITFKAGWRWIGLQYTNIDYKASSPYDGNFDASNIGIIAIGRF